MLTDLEEAGRSKCFPYFPTSPNDTLTIEDFAITMVEKRREQGYIISELTLKRGKESHIITHFWYREWPDHDVPAGPGGNMAVDTMLSLVLTVRNFRRMLDEGESPLLVHCSAGVGRTGTYIALDQVPVTTIRIIMHACHYHFAVPLPN